MFVGEGPGADEDEQGVPFVGRAGQLLTKMIEAMGISRNEVFIANVVKCRPPNNRNPEPDEIAECSPFLLRQVQLVSPKIIVALGTFASQTLLETDTPIGQLRGQYHQSQKLVQKDGSPIKIMPTFHPAFCLRNPNMKKPVWEDLQKVMTDLGLTPTSLTQQP
jgi:DNA polymerase